LHVPAAAPAVLCRRLRSFYGRFTVVLRFQIFISLGGCWVCVLLRNVKKLHHTARLLGD
jgi:hypothetical protein